MDPLSIAGSAVGLSVSVFKISQILYTGYDEVRSIDSNVQFFHQELVTLSESLQSLSDGLKHPDFNAAFSATIPESSDKSQHLSNLKHVLSDCEASVRQLERVLDKIRDGAFFGHGILRKPAQALQLDRRTSDLDRIRKQLQTYHNAMQLSLHMINILIAANASVKLGVLDSRVEKGFSDLKAEMIGLRFGLQDFLANPSDKSLLHVEHEMASSRHIQDYVMSAENLVSSATEYYGSTAGSVTNGPTSVVNFDPERKQQVENWVPGETTSENELSVEDDERYLVEEAETLRTLAEESLAAKEYPKAELYFARFLTITKDVTTWPKSDILEAKMDLARVYSALEKHSKVRELLEPYSHKSDLPPPQQFRIFHNIAHACYLDSDFEAAISHGKAAFRGRRNFFGRGHQTVQESAILLVKIFEGDGKIEDADVYRRLGGIASGVTSTGQELQTLAVSTSNIKSTVSTTSAGSDFSNANVNSVSSETEESKVLQKLRKRGYDIYSEESRNKALAWAVERNNISVVRTLLSLGVDVETRHRCGLGREALSTPLACAARRNHLEILTLLLHKGADARARMLDDYTALHFAASVGDEAVVQKLLNHGAKVNARTENGLAPLSLALDGHGLVAQVRLKHGADTSAGNYTPLHIASKSGHEAIVLVLLNHGAQINDLTKIGFTPLSLALENGYEAVFRVLLQRGADTNAGNYKPLHIASKVGDEAVVQKLLNHGAKVNALTENGLAPLFFASENGHEAVIRTLLNNGADTNAGNYKPLHIASKSGREAIVRVLLNHGAEVNALTENGLAPLFFASENGHEAVVQILLNNGADTNAGNYTPLYGASKSGHEAIVRVLLKNGAQINALTNIGFTPLHIGSENGHKAVVQVLLRNGAEIDIGAGNGGKTPLFYAATYGHKAIVRILLEQGASIDATLRKGSPLLDALSRSGYIEVLKLLDDAKRTSKAGKSSWYASRFK